MRKEMLRSMACVVICIILDRRVRIGCRAGTVGDLPRQPARTGNTDNALVPRNLPFCGY